MTTTFNEIPNTLKELLEVQEKNYLSTHEVLTRIREIEIEERKKVVIPEYKTKPRTSEFYKKNNDPTAKELRAYADAVEGHEKYNRARDKAQKKQRNATPNTGDLMEQFIRHESGLVDIPKRYQDKVYRFAWEQGHSSGYSEVFYYLQELVGIFVK
jgi:hypothetical protein